MGKIVLGSSCPRVNCPGGEMYGKLSNAGLTGSLRHASWYTRWQSLQSTTSPPVWQWKQYLEKFQNHVGDISDFNHHIFLDMIFWKVI